jgi:hypothetical protein
MARKPDQTARDGDRTRLQADAPCPLCGRPMRVGSVVDQHHLVPKSKGGRITVLMHRICHRKLHTVLSEEELAREYATPERLREQPDIAAFIRWIRRRPPEFDDRHRRPKRP